MQADVSIVCCTAMLMLMLMLMLMTPLVFSCMPDFVTRCKVTPTPPGNEVAMQKEIFARGPASETNTNQFLNLELSIRTTPYNS